MADTQIPSPGSEASINDLLGESDSFREAQRREAARESEFRRRERFRNVVHRGAVWMALLAPYLLAAFVLIMGWHYLGPAKWTWMSASQIDKAEAVASGVIFSAIFFFLRRYVSPTP